MKVVYVAGPFRGANAWEVERNIRTAEGLGFEVAKAGMSPLIPHANTRFFNGTMTDEFWLEATLALLRKADAVVLTLDWFRSAGARGEVREAMRLGIPVFDFFDCLVRWRDTGEATFQVLPARLQDAEESYGRTATVRP